MNHNNKDDNTCNAQQRQTTIIFGATGYIGKAVVKESVRRGYKTIAVVRDRSRLNQEDHLSAYFQGAQVVECTVSDPSDVLRVVTQAGGINPAVISCLAAPSGYQKDVYAIDYQATKNCLEAAKHVHAKQFVLLSAFCVQNPLLHLQRAKLKMEAALQEQTFVSWTIVRPTAFFKSVSRQFEKVADGKPYLAFGDGTLAKCNPIAEEDLATFMMDCISSNNDGTAQSRRNCIVTVGGDSPPITHKENAQIMGQVLDKSVQISLYPLWMVTMVKFILSWISYLFYGSATLDNMAEMARIVHYYATESMCNTHEDNGQLFGTITVRDHYERILLQRGKAKDERVESPLELMTSSIWRRKPKSKLR